MDANEKSERLVEVASAVLDAAPNRRLNTVVLNKAIFYLDLASLRDRGELLTGNAYIALQQGPVVAQYQKRLIDRLEARGIAHQVDEWDGSKPVTLTALPEYRFLDEPARVQASRVTAFFANQTSKEASDYSHENPGWLLAWAEYGRTGKPCSINMQVALQQILQEDPWMDQPLLGAKDILAAADAEDGEDW